MADDRRAAGETERRRKPNGAQDERREQGEGPGRGLRRAVAKARPFTLIEEPPRASAQPMLFCRRHAEDGGVGARTAVAGVFGAPVRGPGRAGGRGTDRRLTRPAIPRARFSSASRPRRSISSSMPRPRSPIRSRSPGAARSGAGRRRSPANMSSPPGRRRNSVKRDHPELPDVIRGGSPHNPMGARAITLDRDEIAIHGTTRGDARLDRHGGLLRLHPHAERRRDRPLRPGRGRRAGDDDAVKPCPPRARSRARGYWR